MKRLCLMILLLMMLVVGCRTIEEQPVENNQITENVENKIEEQPEEQPAEEPEEEEKVVEVPDDSQAKTEIPKAGVENISYIVAIIAIAVIMLYVKNKEYEDIK